MDFFLPPNNPTGLVISRIEIKKDKCLIQITKKLNETRRHIIDFDINFDKMNRMRRRFTIY